jgi:hypothetical protein
MSTALPTYNGWPNYPTWNVALWMDNDEGSYAYARELTAQAIGWQTDDGELNRDGAIADLAESLESWHEEAAPELEGFAADVYGWAIGFVDWRHIAEHLIEETA